MASLPLRVAGVCEQLMLTADLETMTARKLREEIAKQLGIAVEELETPEMRAFIAEQLDNFLMDRSNQQASSQLKPSNGNKKYKENMESIREKAIHQLETAQTWESASSFKPTKKQKRTDRDEKSVITVKSSDQLDRLKSYVTKCGVRKVWKKELAGLSTPASIRRVKKILEELGVEGRPTLEKCKRIKERREVSEEMQAIDAGNIIESRLRTSRSGAISSLHNTKKAGPIASSPIGTTNLDLSKYGDSESE